MEKLKKEFILNASIVSAVLAVVLAAIGAALNVNSSELSNRDDWFILFIILFLVSYVVNLVVSIINYGLGQKVKSLALRLLTFNVLGILIVMVTWYFINDVIVLASFSTFILFSIVALIINQTKSNSHA